MYIIIAQNNIFTIKKVASGFIGFFSHFVQLYNEKRERKNNGKRGGNDLIRKDQSHNYGARVAERSKAMDLGSHTKKGS